MTKLSIVVVDDDSTQREVLSGFLKNIGHEVNSCASGEECISYIDKNYVDVVITDYRMPGMNGLELLKKVKEINPEIQVLVLTAYGTIEDAVEAMKSGAWDYLTKPVDLEELEIKLEKIAEHNVLIRENQMLRSQVSKDSVATDIVYKSKAMEEVLNLVARVSNSNAAVMILGESGTGKELIAKAIHDASYRKEKPFVPVNCASIPETLFESELFGHEKGAFTGAHERRKGWFEIADGGTIFLDEVADIPLSIQVKLLRVLQEKEFSRLGSSQIIKSDVRIISATNKDIYRLVEEGKFRSDLFFRLNVITIKIPPLRERKEDIPALVDFFIKKHAKINRREIKGISAEGMDLLMKYDYPGNVRELENIIERAVILARGDVITTVDLPLGDSIRFDMNLSGSLNEQVERLEISLIKKALEESNRVKTEAARKLGISERMLRYKMKKYGLE